MTSRCTYVPVFSSSCAREQRNRLAFSEYRKSDRGQLNLTGFPYSRAPCLRCLLVATRLGCVCNLSPGESGMKLFAVMKTQK